MSSPTRSIILVAGFFALLACIVAAYAWHGGTEGFLFDDAMYLLMADFFSPYVETNPYVQAFVMEQSRFPPGYSLLIALLGGGSPHMQASHLINAGFLVASAVAYFLWMRGSSFSTGLALGAVALFSLLPNTLDYVLEIRSEYLYLAFVFAALYFIDIVRQGTRNTHELLLASALCIACCVLTRTVGVALVIAFFLYLLALRVDRRFVYFLISILPYSFWLLIKGLNGYHGSYVEDMEPYTSWSGLATLATNEVPRRTLLILKAWNTNFGANGGSSYPLLALSGLLFILAVAGLVQRLRQGRFDAYYVLIYAGLIVAWPYPEHMVRFVYPLVPFGIAYALMSAGSGLSFLIRKLALPRAGAVFVLIAGFVLITPNAVFVTQRFFAPFPESVPQDFRHTRYWLRGYNLAKTKEEIERRSQVITLLERAGERIPEDQCIYTAHSPFTVLHAQRVSILYPKPFSWSNLQQCRYFLAMNLDTRDFPPMYPAEQLTQHGAKLIDLVRDSNGRIDAVLLERVP